MKPKTPAAMFSVLLMAFCGTALACEYKAGETKYVDYATCTYGAESIEVINLPENSNWESCIYLVQAFRPEKLLAVTKERNGTEVVSINDRSQIGNPCYMTKRSCDAALKAFKASQ